MDVSRQGCSTQVQPSSSSLSPTQGQNFVALDLVVLEYVQVRRVFNDMNLYIYSSQVFILKSLPAQGLNYAVRTMS